ncbi:MAG: fatty acid desaturase [Rhodopirellula sp.]|nr:fatty acid desaturase [Rhodopirellula sp.]
MSVSKKVSYEHLKASSELRQQAREFETPSNLKASWQLLNSMVLFIALWGLMHFLLDVSWWLVASVAVLAGVVLIRIFIIFHDCGHGVFFSSMRANHWVGFFCGLLVFTPYRQWHRDHADHHHNTGNLDGRGPGEVWTMTVDEFLEAPRWKQYLYRMMRNPLFLFGVVPLLFFVVLQRLPTRASSLQLKQSIWIMNIAAVIYVSLMMVMFGVVPYLYIQTIVIVVAAGAGFWLFYVQHQFETVLWKRSAAWDYTDAALQGSSYYKLPLPLQWCTGNIGFHHVHHLFPRIPNYYLEDCHNALPILQQVPVVTLTASFGTLKLKLWDECSHRLVRFSDVKHVGREERDAGRSVVVEEL